MKKNPFDMICSVAELSALFERSHGLDDFLDAVVSMISKHMHADVCSIYLIEPDTRDVVLRANIGLSNAVGQIRLHMGEGLSGLALKELRPICVGRASEHPYYKFFPGTHEEEFEAFLAVPIARGLERIGVLVLQHREQNHFAGDDVKALRAIAAQLAQTIENASLLISMHKHDKDEQQSGRALDGLGFVKGKAVSSGIALGKAAVMDAPDVGEFLDKEFDSDRPVSRKDFQSALKLTEQQLERLQEEAEKNLGEVAALIFNAHLLILKDEEFSGAIDRMIREGIPPRNAILQVIRQFISLFEKSPNPRMREKIHDIKDLGHRLLHNLLDPEEDHADYSGHIIIASEILPSDVIRAATQKAEGLILLSGGMSAHVSILARSIRMPLVVPDEPRLLKVAEGTNILMDGGQGTIYIEPDEHIISRYREIAEAEEEIQRTMQVFPETRTLDGVQVNLLANVNLVSDLSAAIELLAEGVGLYRSEFPFLIRDDFPMEEEQYAVYRRIVERMEGKEVTFRTLDIGGDKMLSYYAHMEESNPFLGLRAIRFSLRNKDIFKDQLRAMLRATHDASARIMFPMISSVDEFVEARAIVDECRRELAAEELPASPHVKLGVMVELPSAVEIVEELAEHADFMSVGTNDLIQYMIGVDRTNDQVSSYYIPYHPAVLRALKRIADAAEAQNCELCVCGEATADMRLIPFLLGIGVRKMSLNVHYLPRVQQWVMNTSVEEAEKLSAQMLSIGRISEMEQFIARFKEES